MKQDREYLLLLDLLSRLVESTKGTELNADTLWLEDTQPLAAKFIMHCGSIFHLTQGTRISKLLDREISYLDHHSIIVLVRAVYENYLAFNFIYIATQTPEEKEFRHNVWKLGTFLDRQKVPTTEEENIKKQQSVDTRTQGIRTSNVFTTLCSSQQKKALKGEWRLGYHWADLAELANLDKKQFRATYRYLCSYAHTGHLSIFQMQKAVDQSETSSLTDVWIDSVMGVISHFIYDYIEVYPEATELFKKYPEAGKLAFINDSFGRISGT